MSFLPSCHSPAPSCLWGCCFQDVVSPETPERGGCRSIPTAEGAWWALPPAVHPQSHPPCVTAQGRPPNTALPLLLATSPASQGAGTELVGSLPEMGSALIWMCPGDSRDDASIGSSPGSRKILSPESGNHRFGSATSACIMDRWG